MERNQNNTIQKNQTKKIIFLKWHLLTELVLMIWYLDTNRLGTLLPWHLQILAPQHNMMFYFPPPCSFLSDSVMNDIGVASYWVTKVRAQTHFYDSSKILLCPFLENEKSLFEVATFSTCTKKNDFCALLKERLLCNTHHIRVSHLTSINPDMFLARC